MRQTIPPSVALFMHKVKPSDTGTEIGQPNDDHHVYLRPGADNGLLFLFLPGTGQKPEQFTKLLAAAAAANYHVIGLDYRQLPEVAQLCNEQPDCFEPAREEAFDGQGESALVTIGPNNCILHRLVKLLEWLDQHHASEHWGQFLQTGKPVWSKIAVAGHSQGGGHAAFIAKLFVVHRVVMFSSVSDATGNPSWVSAPWLKKPHATPIDRYFGFTNTHDTTFFPRIKVNFTTLGLLGALKQVDGSSPPYGGSHQLKTSLQMPSGVSAHNGIATDSTPMTPSGSPVYEAVWRYLLGP